MPTTGSGAMGVAGGREARACNLRAQLIQRVADLVHHVGQLVDVAHLVEEVLGTQRRCGAAVFGQVVVRQHDDDRALRSFVRPRNTPKPVP